MIFQLNKHKQQIIHYEKLISIINNFYNFNFYLSSNTNWDSSDYKFNNSQNVPSLQVGASSNYISNTIFGSDFEYNQPFGYYYILVKVDGDESITESNENDNVISIPIRYRNTFSDTIKPIRAELLSKIYNFKGELLDNINEENLEKGLYIIKYSDGTSKKIYKQ